MNKIKTHKDLKIFQLSFSSDMKVFAMTKSFPKEETYSLTDKYDHIIAMLVKMIHHPDKWSI